MNSKECMPNDLEFQRIHEELKKFHFKFQIIPCEFKVNSEVFIVHIQVFIMNCIEFQRIQDELGRVHCEFQRINNGLHNIFSV